VPQAAKTRRTATSLRPRNTRCTTSLRLFNKYTYTGEEKGAKSAGKERGDQDRELKVEGSEEKELCPPESSKPSTLHPSLLTLDSSLPRSSLLVPQL